MAYKDHSREVKQNTQIVTSFVSKPNGNLCRKLKDPPGVLILLCNNNSKMDEISTLFFKGTKSPLCPSVWNN